MKMAKPESSSNLLCQTLWFCPISPRFNNFDQFKTCAVPNNFVNVRVYDIKIYDYFTIHRLFIAFQLTKLMSPASKVSNTVESVRLSFIFKLTRVFITTCWSRQYDFNLIFHPCRDLNSGPRPPSHQNVDALDR